MHVDLTEDAKAFHVKADLPGIKKDDIKVGALASSLACMQRLLGAALLLACNPSQTGLKHLLRPCCLCFRDAAQGAVGCLFGHLLPEVHSASAHAARCRYASLHAA